MLLIIGVLVVTTLVGILRVPRALDAPTLVG